jgi:hypothetical protein
VGKLQVLECKANEECGQTCICTWDQFKRFIYAGGAVGGVLQNTSTNNKQVNTQATGERIAGNTLQGLVLNGFTVCISS